MFFIPRVNEIESDEGFSVKVLGRTGLRYREGCRTLHVDSEVLNSPAFLAIDASSIRAWDPPFWWPAFRVFRIGGKRRDRIGPERQKQIVQNIQAAFRFRGLEIEVVW